MTVKKAAKTYIRQSKKPFDLIYRDVLQNLKNSDALAAYCHLTSKSEDWEINDQYLMNHFGWGRDKTRKALKCLILNGLITYKQEHNDDGTFSKNVVIVEDGMNFAQYTPYNHKNENHRNIRKLQTYPQKIQPLTENPSTDNPSTDNYHLKNNRAFKEYENKKSSVSVDKNKKQKEKNIIYKKTGYEMTKNHDNFYDAMTSANQSIGRTYNKKNVNKEEDKKNACQTNI